MTDFDFDELDRAVAGVLNDPSSDKSQSAAAQQPMTPVSSGEPATSSEPQPTGQAPAARRSAGRFMDMVHPASDMLSSTRSSQSTSQDSTPVAKPLETPLIQQPSSELFETTPASEGTQPLESPFLPDAKVEKRPLGGSSFGQPDLPVTTEEGESSLSSSSEATPSEATHMPDPIDFALQNQLNEELASEETSQPTEPVETQPSEEVEAPEEAKMLESASVEPAVEQKSVDDELTAIEAETPETINLPSEDDTTHPQPEPVVEEEVPIPTGPTSITQQYQEQPSSTTESGAIYDTEAYHQPLVARPVKKKSGLWVIVWILLLVILGAAAGAGFYLYVLPTL